MGFASGSITFKRFYVDGDRIGHPGEDLIEALAKHAIGRDAVIEADRTEIGWISGRHVLDTAFDFARNVIGESLLFALRIDTNKVPADLVRSYQRQYEEAALSASGRETLTKQERQECRDQARSQADREAASGMHRRIKHYPVLWDASHGELYLAATAPTVIDRFVLLFDLTFGRTLTAAGAGAMASRLAGHMHLADGLHEIRPAPFVEPPDGAGVEFEDGLEIPRRNDFLGNEWLLWLWFTTHAESAEVLNSLGHGVTTLFRASLDLKCAFGLSGSETIRADDPTRLPEAKTAIATGKIPTKAGLHMVNKGESYVFTVKGDAMAISGLKLPPVEEEDARVVFEERIGQLRHFRETLDQVYAVFLSQRLGADWPKRLERIRRWIAGRTEPVGRDQPPKESDPSPTDESAGEPVDTLAV